MSVYFIADTHFSHANSLRFRTQFESIDEHDDYIISRWNSLIHKRDTVYHLGDFSFTAKQEAVNSYAKRLNGHIKLMPGNHDQVVPLTDNVKIINEGLYKYKDFWLSHCPIHPQELRNKINIHGHVHSSSVEEYNYTDSYFMRDEKYFNVSCEAIDYMPIQLEKLRAISYS